MTALNLTCVAHSEGLKGSVIDRQSIYRTQMGADGRGTTFRTRVRKDPYPNQQHAVLELLLPTGEWSVFYANQDAGTIGDLYRGPDAWEVENDLIVVLARHLGADPYTVHFETEGALAEAGYLPAS